MRNFAGQDTGYNRNWDSNYVHAVMRFPPGADQNKLCLLLKMLQYIFFSPTGGISMLPTTIKLLNTGSYISMNLHLCYSINHSHIIKNQLYQWVTDSDVLNMSQNTLASNSLFLSHGNDWLMTTIRHFFLRNPSSEILHTYCRVSGELKLAGLLDSAGAHLLYTLLTPGPELLGQVCSLVHSGYNCFSLTDWLILVMSWWPLLLRMPPIGGI